MAIPALEVTSPGIVNELTAVVTQRPLTAVLLVGAGVLANRTVLREPLDKLFNGDPL